MMGYGPEDNHFVIELTYNYGVDKYRLGNDFLGITLCDATNRIVERATKAHEGLVKRIDEKTTEIEAPDGYKFFVVHAESAHGDPVRMVTISCRCLKTSLTFWHDILGMKKEHDSHNPGGVVFLTFGEGQARLGLKELGGGTHVDHATAFGRIAFAVPARQLPEIERIVAEFGQILTPLTKLDTPGKASVEVVIVADPVIKSALQINAVPYVSLNKKKHTASLSSKNFTLGWPRDMLRWRRGLQGIGPG